MIFHEVRGSGPALLLVTAGGADSSSYAGLAGALAADHTVITFDKRGYGRSSGEPVTDLRVHADDAATLLSTLDIAAASVFGSSSGAIIALDLATRFPDRVREVVAHEPPLAGLLPPEQRPKLDLAALAEQAGQDAAIRAFAESIGVQRLDRTTENPYAARNRAAFLGGEAQAVRRYAFDPAALAATGVPVTIAAGVDSRGYFPYACAAAVAERLGTGLVEMIGDHAGFSAHPAAFADNLRRLLRTPPTP